MSKQDEVRWLIEKGTPATWLKSMFGIHVWTDNADDAIGFCRERDAIAVKEILHGDNAIDVRVCDHLLIASKEATICLDCVEICNHVIEFDYKGVHYDKMYRDIHRRNQRVMMVHEADGDFS